MTTHYLQIKEAGVTEGKLEGYLVNVSNDNFGHGIIKIKTQDGKEKAPLLAEKIDFTDLNKTEPMKVSANELTRLLTNKKVYLELQVKGENVVAVKVKAVMVKANNKVNVKDVKRVDADFVWTDGPVIASAGKTYGKYEFTLEGEKTDFKDNKFKGYVEIDEFDKMRGNKSLKLIYDLYDEETESNKTTNVRVTDENNILPVRESKD